MAELPWSILVFGDPGVGKSRLCGTTPYPRLLLDAEGRAHFLPGTKTYWDPTSGPPPVADGSWETCVVNVRDYKTVGSVYQWLESRQHQFRSVMLDSLMEIQKRLIDSLSAGQLKIQDWGEILRNLEGNVRAFRDLTTDVGNPLSVVVVTCGGMAGEDGKQRPMLQGQLKATLPYYFDTVGYLYNTQDSNGGVARLMATAPSQFAVAKDATDMLPAPVVPDPDLGVLWGSMNERVYGARN